MSARRHELTAWPIGPEKYAGRCRCGMWAAARFGADRLELAYLEHARAGAAITGETPLW